MTLLRAERSFFLVDALREFDWDAEKAALNDITHGVAFPFATAVFRDPLHADFDVSRPEDHEERRKAVGRIGRKLYVAVFTMRDDVTGLISARRTNRTEDLIYAANR